MPDDPFDLQRFVEAQDRGQTWRTALAELEAGHKRTHWMWFVLPQLRGLGRSPTAQHYGVSGLPEARAYLAHPLLGPRLLACCRALTGLTAAAAPDAESVLGPVDAQKLRSSMTLFALADPAQPAFQDVLDRYFAGRRDAATVALLPPG